MTTIKSLNKFLNQVSESNELRNNPPVLKIKECPNGHTELKHSDFTIKLSNKFSRILDNLNYSTLGNSGIRYNLDGSQDNVYVTIHYDPDKGHTIIVSDIKSRRRYSLKKEEEVQDDGSAFLPDLPRPINKLPVVRAVKIDKDKLILITEDGIFTYMLAENYETLKDFHRFGIHGRKATRSVVVPKATPDPTEVYLVFGESNGGLRMEVMKDGVMIDTYRVLFPDEYNLPKEPQTEEGVVKTINLPKIEDIRKKTDEALEITISKIASLIERASSEGESAVVVPKGEFPDSSSRKILEKLSEAGYRTCTTALGGLVITWH